MKISRVKKLQGLRSQIFELGSQNKASLGTRVICSPRTDGKGKKNDNNKNE